MAKVAKKKKLPSPEPQKDFFRFGWTVVCTQTADKSKTKAVLTVGKKYEVKEWKNKGDTAAWNVIVDDCGTPHLVNYEYLRDCFKVAYDFFRVGQTIVCTKIPPGHSGDFTQGKRYTVVEFQDHGDTPEWNSITNDRGNLFVANHSLLKPYFELVEGEVEDKLSFVMETFGFKSQEELKAFLEGK